MRAEDKRRLLTPGPEPNPQDQGKGCFLWLGILLLAALVGAVSAGSKIFVVLAAALTALALFAIYAELQERSNLKRFAAWMEENQRFAIVVTSDSPKWANHINDKWLGVFGEHVSVLNYSKRHEWPDGIESKSVDDFSQISGDHPIVIVPRRSGRPAVYRFRFALTAASHGDGDALKSMEERLFKEYAEWREQN